MSAAARSNRLLLPPELLAEGRYSRSPSDVNLAPVPSEVRGDVGMLSSLLPPLSPPLESGPAPTPSRLSALKGGEQILREGVEEMRPSISTQVSSEAAPILSKQAKSSDAIHSPTMKRKGHPGETISSFFP